MATTYCPACAEQVEAVLNEARRPSCAACGLILPAGLEAVIEGVEPLYGTVLLADDTQLIREILKDGMAAEFLAERVVSAEDGQGFIQLAAEFMYNDWPVNLAILDLEMPVLGGAATALALRGMERGCKRKPAPIIFFTSHALTDDLRRLMHFSKPAHYLNKGADASPARIMKRLREVMRALKM